MSETLLKKSLKKFYSEDKQAFSRVSKKKKKRAASSVESFIATASSKSGIKDKNLAALLRLSSNKVDRSVSEKVIENITQKPVEVQEKSKEDGIFGDEDFVNFEKEYFVSKV